MIVRLQIPGHVPHIDEVEVDLAQLPRTGEVVDFDEDYPDEALAGESFEVRRVIHPASRPTYAGKVLPSKSSLVPAPEAPVCILIA